MDWSKEIIMVMKRKWRDKISNEEVIKLIEEDELCLYRGIQTQKTAFIGHVLRVSSGEDALHILAVLLKAVRSRPDAARSCTTTAALNGKMPTNQAAVRHR